jgi:hypothetical protein
LVLDLKSRRPQRIEPVFKHILHLFDDLPSTEEPEKLPSPVRSQMEKSYTVRYSDIDMHHHVNNIKYIEWILDSYPFEMNQTHQIHTFEILPCRILFGMPYRSKQTRLRNPSCTLFIVFLEKRIAGIMPSKIRMEKKQSPELFEFTGFRPTFVELPTCESEGE